MKTSLKGLCAILAHEAIVLRTYDDGVGVLTIGAGHTKSAGNPTPAKGMEISLDDALSIFKRDMVKYEDAVNKHVKVKVTQSQFDALVSWHFNTGRISTATLTKKVNAQDWDGAAKEFARWNKAKGNVVEGLVNRRKGETAMFADGDYGSPQIAVFDRKGSTPRTIDLASVEHLLGDMTVSDEDASTEELLANPKSQLLPKFRPKISDDWALAIQNKFIDLVPEDRRGDAMMVIGIRGYYQKSMGNPRQNDRGIYDDAIMIMEPDGAHPFNGNTDPSSFRKGIANLKAPQSVRYVPGPHGFKRKNGPYPAFRQNSNCTVVRDQKGDDTGMFWINLHRGGINGTSSAGCQTVPPHQWDEFERLVNLLLKQHGQKTFYYVLIDNHDLPPEPKVELEVPPEVKELIENVDTSEKASNTNKAIGVGTVVSTGVGIKEATDAINQAKDGVSSVLDAGPWVLMILMAAGVGFYIWRSRTGKAKLAALAKRALQ